MVPALTLGTGTFGGGNEFFKAWGASDVAEARAPGRHLPRSRREHVRLGRRLLERHGGGNPRPGDQGAARRGAHLHQGQLPARAGPERGRPSRYHLINAVEASLRRLGTDYIDLYQLHAFDALTPVEESLGVLDDLVRAGKIRYIGCSNFSGWHLMKSLAVSEKHGLARYVAHQAYYSLVGRDYEWELMPLALEQGVGAVVWSPLGWGRLTGKIRRGQPLPEVSRLQSQIAVDKGPQVPNEQVFKIVDAIDEVAKETGKTSSADRAQLAPAAAVGRQRHHRRAQRRAAAPEPRRRGLETDAGANREAGCRQRGAAALSVLAPAQHFHRQEPAGGLTPRSRYSS